MEKCLICLELNNYLSVLSECGKCKIYYHESCYKGVKKMKLNCPICRQTIQEYYYDEYYFGYFDNFSILFRFLEITVFRLFMNYPNIVTLLLLQLIMLPIILIIISSYILLIGTIFIVKKLYRISNIIYDNLYNNIAIIAIDVLNGINIYFR